MGTTLQPTPDQIATIDPTRDPDTAARYGVTLAHRQAHVRTVACPEPRCITPAGADCRTPNGWLRDFHASRCDLAYGRTPAKKATTHKLTDPQAEWLEHAAQSDEHRLYAPDQYGTLRGDANRRQRADGLERAGLIHQVATDTAGWRVFELTTAGWRTYWTHRLVIRRDLTALRHPDTCPCNTTRPADTN